MENKNLYELLNSSIQSSQRNKVNYSSLYALLRAMLQQLDSLRETCIQAGEDGSCEVAYQQKSAITVERCCHRMDALEGTLRSLRDTMQKSPELAELCQSVCWDLIQPECLQEELLDSSSPLKPSHTAAAPGSSVKSEQSAISASSESQGLPVTDQMLTSSPESPESCKETVMSPRTFSKLMERDIHTQNMTDQLKQQGVLIERLMSDRQKLEALEEMIMNLTGSGAASERVDADGEDYLELKEQISINRRSVEKLEDDLKQLEAQQALREESGTDQQLQDQEPVNSSLAEPSTPLKPSHTPVDPGSVSGLTPKPAMDAQPTTETSSASSGSQKQSCPQTDQLTAASTMSPNASDSVTCNETAMSPRTVSKLLERFSKLEALVASLKEGKVDQSQLKQLREIINKRVDSSRNMTDQKLEALEEMMMNLTGSGAASERVDADGEDYLELKEQISINRRSVEKLEDDLKQLEAQQALREESRTDQQLQDQEPVNLSLAEPSTPLKPSHTPVDPGSVSGSTPKPARDAQPTTETSSASSGSQKQSRPQTDQLTAASPMSPNASDSGSCNETAMSPRTVSNLLERFSKLEALVASLKEGKVDQSQLKQLREIINKRVDSSRNMTDQKLEALEEMMMNQTGSGAASERVDADGEDYLKLKEQISIIRRSVQRLEDNVKQLEAQQALKEESRTDQQLQDQKVVLQLQAECERLHETTRCLQEDNIQKQSYIQELYKTTEELEESKAGKELLESVIKSDKLSLASKVSHMHFDSAIEELNALLEELLNKVCGLEQVIERLSSETECKITRVEFDLMKKQLEERFGLIHKKLQDQKAPESGDAAALRKQLVDTYHCLCCDRPIIKNLTAPNSMELPSSYPYSNKCKSQFTVSPQKKFGQQDGRSKNFSEQKVYSYPAVSRSCGGKSTITTRPMLLSERKKLRDSPARAQKSDFQQNKQETEESSCSLEVEADRQ